MTPFDADFDYLYLLGVEPAELAKSTGAVADRLKAKKREWTAQALNPLYQEDARQKLERAREFEGILLEPAALVVYVNHIQQCRLARRTGQKEAVALLVSNAVAGRREITTAQRDLMAKEIKAEAFPDGLLDEVLQERGFKVVSDKRSAPIERPKLPARAPILDGVIMSAIQNSLKILGKGSLYELLDLADNTPPPRIVSTAQTQFLYWSKKLPKTSETTAWEKTLQAAMTYLKDPESKKRYDNGLFNLRVQRFVKRVDLVLVGPSFGPEEQGHLTRIGIEEFGFTAPLIDQCIAARMAEKGLTPANRAAVSVQFHGQIRCRRCGLWNGPKSPRCHNCGGSLHRKCENPACRGGPLAIDYKVCPNCTLPVGRGTQYRTLLRLADAFLESGSHASADSVCRLAEQILPGEAVTERLERSAKIRALAVSARHHAAAKAWNAVREDLRQLGPLAPRQSVANVPSLERVASHQIGWIEKLQAVTPDTDPIEAAKVYLGCLRSWTDCDEAYQKLRLLCKRLESDKRPRLAWQIASRLLDIRPDDDLRAYAKQIEPEMRRLEALEIERRAAMVEYVAAARERRLYAAERAIREIEESPIEGPSPPSVIEFRRHLAEIRAELAEIRDAAASESRRDVTVARYLDLARRCRDCREALLALQTAPLDPPDPPERLEVRLEGNRRVLSWKPSSTGKKPTSYVVQRSLTRPGPRPIDAPFTTIYDGDSLHFSDDDTAHNGTIIRYMIHGVVRGRIELDGSVIRAYEIASQPVAFRSVLVWQEVMNLRCVRRDRALELTWHQPSGARQVLIERWPGGPNDQRLGMVILPATAEGRLVDADLAEGTIFTYRVSCLYDGVDGEFRTPGVCLTDGIVAAPRSLDDRGVSPLGSLSFTREEAAHPTSTPASSNSE